MPGFAPLGTSAAAELLYRLGGRRYSDAMALRTMLKRIAFNILGSGPVLARRLNEIRRAQVSTILNLHQVGPDDGSGYPPLDPKLFDELLGFLKRNFALVTIEELDGPSNGKPKMALSFDDGYKDFVEVALPILRRHGVRVNQNIIPDCVDTGLAPLNVLATIFAGQAPAELVRKLDVPGFDMAQGANGMGLSNHIRNRPLAEQQALAASLLPQFRNWDGFRPPEMMNLDEVRQVKDLHELGAHSYSHASMAFETDEFFGDDLRRCRSWFRDRLDQDLTIYAFPNGSYTDRQVDIARRSGVRHLLLVDEDFVRGAHAIPRFSFDASGAREARFKALGKLRRVA